MKKIFIKSKFKFIRSICIIVILIGGIISIVEAPAKDEYIYYTVCKGDTLWSIAKWIKAEDIRYAIYEIKELNNLEESRNT